MAKNLVISQSMYFPWPGLFNQILLADHYVHYDDVQLTRGFYNRVQIRTQNGSAWMTVPLSNHRRGETIQQAKIDYSQDWRTKHLRLFTQSIEKAQFRDDAINLMQEVLDRRPTHLSELTQHSIRIIANYLGIDVTCEFSKSDGLATKYSGSDRILAICRSFGKPVYITGHGAKNYLDHDLFEKSGIEVYYIEYNIKPYQQSYPCFTPFVTSLDLIAHCGMGSIEHFNSETINWKKFINESD
jgi:hypothetical protein